MHLRTLLSYESRGCYVTVIMFLCLCCNIMPFFNSPHKVMQYKTGKASLFAQGKCWYDRKQSRYGGQTRPVSTRRQRQPRKWCYGWSVQYKMQLALKHCKQCIFNLISVANDPSMARGFPCFAASNWERQEEEGCCAHFCASRVPFFVSSCDRQMFPLPSSSQARIERL